MSKRWTVLVVGFVALLGMAAQAGAYELRLIRAIDAGFPGAPDVVYVGGVNPGEIVSFDVFLDTQGESEIVLFSIGLEFDQTVLQYRPDLSDASDYYPLYAPGTTKTSIPTWLTPVFDPWNIWPGNPPPSGNDVVMVDFIENSLNPTAATATNLYLGTIAFEVIAPGVSPINWSFDAAPDAHIFNVNYVDVSDQVSTVVAWAPEPSTALLVGLGLASVGAMRRRG